LEKLFRLYSWRGKAISAQQAQHIVFTLFTLASFWTFFSYGARPALNRMPPMLLLGFNALIVLVGSMWVYRTLGRSSARYERERMATSLRKQLKKYEFSTLLEGRSLEDLTADEVYTLFKVLSKYSRQLRLQMYTGILQDLLTQQITTISGSFEFFKQQRQELQIEDADHFAAIEEITATQPKSLPLARTKRAPTVQTPDEATLGKTIGKKSRKKLSANTQPQDQLSAHPKRASIQPPDETTLGTTIGKGSRKEHKDNP